MCLSVIWKGFLYPTILYLSALYWLEDEDEDEDENGETEESFGSNRFYD